MILIALAILVAGALIAHQLHRGFHKMTAASDRLVAEVATVRGQVASAVAALTGFVALYKAALAKSTASDDPLLNSLSDELESAIAPLTGAIAANPLPTDAPTPGAGDTTTGDTGAGGVGDDSVAAGAGDDSLTAGGDNTLSGGQADDSVQT